MIVGPTTDLAACHALRRRVFIEEQLVSEAEELDGLDEGALHLLAQIDGRPVGTARILIRGETGKIGRVCVLAEARGQGIGAALMRAALAELRTLPGMTRAKLGAQIHALGFYEALGFRAFGPEYDDAGIAHRDMELML
ncbi:putative N-acetyltransferase YjcF [Pseudogemmobacter humi]|uniref:Putative N-acetyltransferase YjcF n=1 Tax=Pseudogemmobacter humi TaxID=2483812 RepID=A0A3P5X514_9RHOB|nr:GNAT family N-acetyltransferase [Pseudogemmobacter humi]VDC23259.1 putative N-acetyltransferase YjcF [Pseudogemmobacter humi]